MSFQYWLASRRQPNAAPQIIEHVWSTRNTTIQICAKTNPNVSVLLVAKTCRVSRFEEPAGAAKLPLIARVAEAAILRVRVRGIHALLTGCLGYQQPR